MTETSTVDVLNLPTDQERRQTQRRLAILGDDDPRDFDPTDPTSKWTDRALTTLLTKEAQQAQADQTRLQVYTTSGKTGQQVLKVLHDHPDLAKQVHVTTTTDEQTHGPSLAQTATNSALDRVDILQPVPGQTPQQLHHRTLDHTVRNVVDPTPSDRVKPHVYVINPNDEPYWQRVADAIPTAYQVPVTTYTPDPKTQAPTATTQTPSAPAPQAQANGPEHN